MDLIKRSTNEEEIDLRQVILRFWRGRWIIVGATLVLALIALVACLWILPRKYQATAYIAINQPILSFTLGNVNQDPSSLSTTVQMPDINSVAELAQAPGIMNQILSDPSVIKSFGDKPLTLKDINDMSKVEIIGKNIIRLQVTDQENKRAALLANTWAVRLISIINDTYSIGSIAETLDNLEPQVKGSFDQAQAALEAELATSTVDALQAQYDNKKSDYQCVLTRVNVDQRVLEDLQGMKQRLETLPPESRLSLGDALSLVTLQQRALSSQKCEGEIPNTENPPDLQFQIGSDILSNQTLSSALNDISSLQTSLQASLSDLESQRQTFERQISQLDSQLENANATISRLTMTRDLQESLFKNLERQQGQVKALGTGGQIASLSLAAVTPEEKTFPQTGLVTAIAAVAGFFLSIAWVFFQGWWKDKGISLQEPSQK